MVVAKVCIPVARSVAHIRIVKPLKTSICYKKRLIALEKPQPTSTNIDCRSIIVTSIVFDLRGNYNRNTSNTIEVLNSDILLSRKLTEHEDQTYHQLREGWVTKSRKKKLKNKREGGKQPLWRG